MRLAPILVTVLAVLGSIAVFRKVTQHSGSAAIPRDVVAMYAHWKNTHSKLYASPAEDVHRLQMFYDQKLFVDRSNVEYAEALYKRDGEILEAPMFVLNQWSDLSGSEFAAKYTGAKVPEEPLEEYNGPLDNLEAPAMLEQGYQTRVRNQGSCGSCWAFSAIACFEKQYFDATRQRLDLSQQNLVDCDGGSNGCNGGFINSGLNYIRGNSVALSSAYPYVAARGACRGVGKINRINFSVMNYGFSTSAAINAINGGKHTGVTLYAGGKFRNMGGAGGFDASLSGECGNTITHAVNAIGQSGGFLNILNSWGTTWGNGGLKMIKPCSANNLWGNRGSVAWAQ